MKLTAYELWQTRNALLVRPKTKKRWAPYQCEISLAEVERGRARERQLIAEAERTAKGRIEC